MKSKRINAVIMRHLYDVKHNFDRLFDIFYWPILDVIIWGFLTIYLSEKGGAGFDYKRILLSAVILWGVFYAFSRDIAVGFLEEIWSKNLINIFASPLSVGEHIEGVLIVSLIKIAVSFIFTSLLALLFYEFNIFKLFIAFLPYLFNLVVLSLAVGFLVAGLILRYTSKVQTLAWSFSGLLMPVSAVFYPVSTLPKFLQNIAWLLPTSHSFEAMRQILAGGGLSASHFWIGLLENAVYLGLSVIFFKMIFEVSRKRGLLVKLE